MAALPATMRAVEMDAYGGVEALKLKPDLSVPEPKDGQLLVKNRFLGVNFADTLFRSGVHKLPLPLVLGHEGEGTVVTVGSGDVSGFKAGDSVAYLGDRTYAEYTVVSASRAVKIPDGLPPKVACASIVHGLTALTLVREAYPVQKGDWILVHAAAGGTGLWLCQLLKAAGANIIGTASTADKLQLASKAGAQHLINYTGQDVEAEVMKLTGGVGVAAVFDGVGNATFDLSLSCLARKGSMVAFGNASGDPAPLNIARLGEKNIKLLRPVFFGYIATGEEFEHYSSELLRLLAGGTIDVNIHEVYPMSQVARAHQDLEGRKSTGKLLLDPTA